MSKIIYFHLHDNKMLINNMLINNMFIDIHVY